MPDHGDDPLGRYEPPFCRAMSPRTHARPWSQWQMAGLDVINVAHGALPPGFVKVPSIRFPGHQLSLAHIHTHTQTERRAQIEDYGGRYHLFIFMSYGKSFILGARLLGCYAFALTKLARDIASLLYGSIISDALFYGHYRRYCRFTLITCTYLALVANDPLDAREVGFQDAKVSYNRYKVYNGSPCQRVDR